MLSDGDLIASSRRDPKRFVVLFDRHASAVHAYLSRRAGRQAAEDLHAEVWLTAFRLRDRYRPEAANALPWLYGIAKNALRADWRRATRAPEVAVVPIDPWAEVDARLQAQGRRAELRAALRSLDATDREVLLLVAWEGLTPQEASVALGIPAGTARWRLHRARAQLRAALSTSSGPRDRVKEGTTNG